MSIVKSSLTALLSTVAPGAVELLETAISVRNEAAKARVGSWGDYYMHKASDEDFDRELEYEDLDDAKASTVLESFRAAVDAPDEGAIKPLARLARLYVITEAGKRDRLFRSLTRMLLDADAQELDELRSLVVWVLNATTRASVLLTQRARSVDLVKDEHAPNDYVELQNVSNPDCLLSLPKDVTTVLRLLVQSDVFRPSDAMYMGSAPATARFERKGAEILRYALTGTRPKDGA